MASSTEVGEYENPIIRGFNPDPSIIRVDKDFFLITSSFEYFPGIPIYHSTDLIKWELIGHALTRRSQLDIRTVEPGGGIWAPTIRWHKGVFYITAASFTRYRPQDDDRVFPRGFYVKTTDIWDSNSWSEPVYFDSLGYDQDLFWDDDDTCYLSTTLRKVNRTPGQNLKDFAIHICKIDLKTGDSTSEQQLIRESFAGPGVAEGSHIFKRNGYYYLFTAEGGTESGHCEYVSRSKDGPLGPWELGPNNPLWRNGSDDDVQNTGHADLVEDAEGRWWGVFLAVRPVKVEEEGWQSESPWETSALGRETFLVPVTWESDWPVFNGGQKATLQAKAPGLYKLDHPTNWEDDFSKKELQLGWYRKNTPIKKDYSLTDRFDHLRLYGGPYNLSSAECPTLFLRKQLSHETTFETSLSFFPTSSNCEAGAVAYYNYFAYSSIGMRLSPSGGRVIRWRPVEGKPVEKELDSSYSDVMFVVECGRKYRFGFKEVSFGAGNVETQWLGEVERRVLTKDPPLGMPFTGMMLGLYAFGEQQRCLDPADFKYARFH